MSNDRDRRGRSLLIGLSLAVIAVESATVWLADNLLVSKIGRVALVALICGLIIAGSNRARWITVCLAAWQLFTGIVLLAIPPQDTATADSVVRALSMILYPVFAATLIFSPSVQAYMNARRNLRAPGS